MCGIAGIIRQNGSVVDRSELDRMTDALAHRGPDGRGIWQEKNIGLGHRRLKIIDLSDAAVQPMCSPDGRFVTVFNGEIYNFQQERRSLEALGHTFRSTGDTEVLLRLYMVYGEGCLERLRGMFAFAIVDREKQTLFLVRDRVGKKPLVYFQHGGVFGFASEIRSLRCLPECPKELDWESLHHFLSISYLPAPFTGISGIYKLPAGHSMTVDLSCGQVSIRRYWAMQYKPVHDRPLPEWRERILAALEESVRLRMISDVPVGALLSGGIDSSLVVALMSRMHSQPVKTFSIGSRTTDSELPDAERIAKLFGTDHHPIILDPHIIQMLPELVRTYETPLGDPSVIPTYSIFQQTQQAVTVALSGDGGDEAFGGYTRYPILRFSEGCRRLPRPLRAVARAGAHLLHRMTNTTMSYRGQIFHDSLALPWEERIQQYMGAFTEEEKRGLYAKAFLPDVVRTDRWFAVHTADARSRADDMLHGAMNSDLETYLAEDLLSKVDLGSMAHGLEVRSPFLDHELLELSAELPSDLQIHGWNTKWILKHVLKGILPEQTLAKRKQGFRLPLDRWFRDELRPFVHDRLRTGHPLFWQMFDRTAVEDFLRMYYQSSVDYSPQVWMLLWLQEWFSQQE